MRQAISSPAVPPLAPKMSNIPSDLFHEILLRLPAKSLFRFRAVCKVWRRMIDDPFFIKSQTNNQLSSNTLLIRSFTASPLYYISLDSLNFTDDHQTIDAIAVTQLIPHAVPRLRTLPVPSCNGLILIAGEHNDDVKVWAIWNPLTRECHELPHIDTDSFVLGRGIGYDISADDYKVVRIDVIRTDGVLRRGFIPNRTLIYSLKSGAWRMIKNFPCDVLFCSDGVFLNGALHWRSLYMIIALDVESEDYHQLPLPPVLARPIRYEMHLDALGGYLILSYYCHRMKLFHGWVMNDYGVEKSWMKLFSLGEFELDYEVGAFRRLRPVAYIKGKRQVIVQYEGGLFWFDVESNSVKQITIHGLSSVISSQICQASLFRFADRDNVAANRTSGVKTKRKKAHTSLTALWGCFGGTEKQNGVEEFDTRLSIGVVAWKQNGIAPETEGAIYRSK